MTTYRKGAFSIATGSPIGRSVEKISDLDRSRPLEPIFVVEIRPPRQATLVNYGDSSTRFTKDLPIRITERAWALRRFAAQRMSVRLQGEAN